MGREKNTVEYFPFFVKDGKTIFALQKHYGIAGIGYFTQLLRYLSQVPEHWISMQDEYDRERFIQYMGGDESICIHVVYIMCATCKLDKDLFERKGAIVCKDFIDSLEKVYSRRSNGINLEKIQEKVENLPDFDVNILYTSCKHIDNMLQKKIAKGKERKGKETKVKKNCDSLESLTQQKQVAKISNEEDLWIFIESLFREKQDYDNWGKQRTHVKELAKRIEKIYKERAPCESLKGFSNKVISFFWYLKKHGNAFWKDQAFFPSTLNSERIWTMFLEEIKKRKKPTEEDYLKGIE
jgi:hypothetical protein